MNEVPPLVVDNLEHRYGSREALRRISLQVDRAELFAIVGPNGGGKTTLFRIISTAFPPSGGRVAVFGFDVVGQAAEVRRQIGVVFQSPSLDKKLTVWENLWHHGHLYGIAGRGLRQRIDEMLERIGLPDRRDDRVEHLSGGQQRRVEVAKGLLHRPRLLLLDEPTTGLDPGARRDLFDYLQHVREQSAITVVLTTHLMDEADQCDRVAIVNQGACVALGTPTGLAQSVGGQVVYLESSEPEQLAAQIQARWQLNATVVDDSVRIAHERGHELVAQLFDAFPQAIRAVTVRRASLEDVFIQRTGHRFWDDAS